jgi:hypothetical protein
MSHPPELFTWGFCCSRAFEDMFFVVDALPSVAATAKHLPTQKHMAGGLDAGFNVPQK